MALRPDRQAGGEALVWRHMFRPAASTLPCTVGLHTPCRSSPHTPAPHHRTHCLSPLHTLCLTTSCPTTPSHHPLLIPSHLSPVPLTTPKLMPSQDFTPSSSLIPFTIPVPCPVPITLTLHHPKSLTRAFHHHSTLTCALHHPKPISFTILSLSPTSCVHHPPPPPPPPAQSIAEQKQYTSQPVTHFLHPSQSLPFATPILHYPCNSGPQPFLTLNPGNH